MSALPSLLIYKDGDSHRVALYRVHGVNSGDTIDVSADFDKINGVAAMQLTSMMLADCNVATSVIDKIITITQNGLGGDAVSVLVCGSAS